MDENEITKIIENEEVTIDLSSRESFRSVQIFPYVEECWTDSSGKTPLWIFAKIDSENVCFEYSEHGYSDSPSHKWGLMFLNDKSMGDSGAWYGGLSELIEDSGYF